MSKEQRIQESLKERKKEKDKLFKMMIENKSKSSVGKQFLKFKKAHNKALKAYKDVA